MKAENSFFIAQISDCHLFAGSQALHHQANVYHNLKAVLTHLANTTCHKLDALVFTGDLTQDHTLESYQRFNELVSVSNLTCPVYFTPGNHDERALLDSELNASIISRAKDFQLGNWSVKLIDSKGETPAGFVSQQELLKVKAPSNHSQHELVFMHHHPVDVGYFIDRHGLENQEGFWQAVNQNKHIRAVACGHVHNDLVLSGKEFGSDVPLFTCPATSIQFDKAAPTVKNSELGPAYRLFNLHSNGGVTTRTIFLDNLSKSKV